MKTVTLLLKVTAKSVSPYSLMDSSMFQCGLSLKSMMAQLQVGCVHSYVTHIYAYRHLTRLMANLCTHHLLLSFPCDGLSADPGDYSSATRYNVTFRQTAFTDGDDPAPTALSSPILINITDDDIFEGVEYFQARIVETSDRFRVRIGQDTVNVTITDSESFISLRNFCSQV